MLTFSTSRVQVSSLSLALCLLYPFPEHCTLAYFSLLRLLGSSCLIAGPWSRILCGNSIPQWGKARMCVGVKFKTIFHSHSPCHSEWSVHRLSIGTRHRMYESCSHSYGLDDDSGYDVNPLDSVFHIPLAEQATYPFLEMRLGFKMCKHLIWNGQTPLCR